MNTYIYRYENLPIIKLLCNFSIWTISNGVVYIQIYEKLEDVIIVYSNITNTCVVMNMMLEKKLYTKNKDTDEMVALNSAIEDIIMKLKNYNSPEWELFEERLVDKSVYNMHFHMSTAAILKDLFMLLKLHSGNILELSNIIKNIQLKFDFSRDETYFMDEIIKTTSDGLVVLFNIRKLDSASGCNFIDCFRRKSRYIIKYIIAKPKILVQNFYVLI